MVPSLVREDRDVCILMLDATRGIETQDMNIFQLIQKNNKSLVVVVNKWDLVENKDQKVIDTFETAIRKRMAPFVDFPIIFAFLFRIATPLLHRQQSPNVCPIQIVYELVHF